MPPVGDVRFTHAVWPVRDDDASGRYHRRLADLYEPATLDVLHRPSASVFFRLNIPITDRASTRSVLVLLITPDRIASLRATVCDSSDAGSTDDATPTSPPALGLVRERLSGIRLVRRLHFQLHHGLHAQLIVPAGFTLDDEEPDSPARRVFAIASSLAAASMLSLYMPHNVLPTAKLDVFNEAVRQFPSLTVAQRQAFDRTLDVRRWYNGKGGVVVDIQDPDRSPSTPTGAESDAATVAVDTPSGYESPPPEYDAASEQHQPSLDTNAGAAPSSWSAGDAPDTSPPADAAEGLPANCEAPPEYGTSEQQHSLLHAKHLLHCGSEDVDLCRSPKRRGAGSASSLRPQATGLTTLDGRVRIQLQRQQQQIEELKAEVKELERRNKQLQRHHAELDGRHDQVRGRLDGLEGHQAELAGCHQQLESRHDELEGRQDELEDCQAELQRCQSETDDKVESLLVDAAEREDECEDLKQQLPDVGLEIEDWLLAHMDDRVKEAVEGWLRDNTAESIQEYIEQQVKAHVAEIKARMRSALDD